MGKTFLGVCLLALLSVEAEVTHEPVHELRGSYSLKSAYEDSDWNTQQLINATLLWKHSSTSIYFNLTIDSGLVSSDKWYGIGIKDLSVRQGMQDGEYFVIKNLSYPIFQHMNTFSLDAKGGRPSNNTKSSLKPSSAYLLANGDLSVSWEKLLNTSIKDQTLNMTTGNEYTLLYAYGDVTDGFIQPHNASTRGQNTLNLEKWGQEVLKHATLKWKVSDTKADFKLTIDRDFLVSERIYWYGIGLKEPSDKTLMVDAQYFVLQWYQIDSNPKNFLAMNTFGYTENKRPQKNTDNPITSYSIEDLYFSIVVTWTVSLGNLSNSTLNLKLGGQYTLLFAYGRFQRSIFHSSPIEKHQGTSRGYGNIILSNYFSGNATVPPYEMGKETLKNAILEWHVSETAIDFRLHLKDYFEETIDWYGIGFKKPSEESPDKEMIDAQYFVAKNLVYLVNLSPKVVPMNTFGYTKNEHPQKDVNNSVISSLVPQFGHPYPIINWTVSLNALSESNLQLKAGGQYTLLFAYGLSNSSGIIQKHEGTNRGYGNITLSNDFGREMGLEILKNARLQWRVSSVRAYPEPCFVTFELTIIDLNVPKYLWYGIGIKEPSSEISMIDAEYFVIGVYPDNELVGQGNTFGYTHNRAPRAEFYLVSSFSSYRHNSNSSLVVGWVANSLNSSIGFKEGNNYTLLWAYGGHHSYGQELSKHNSSTRGYGSITLSNDFSGNATKAHEEAFSLYNLLLLPALQLLF
mmetsp:Transcript_11853/g.17337  ORF Transcript_11853/g.17337 Transcript_11853/m.17337 type:complete len:741 (-) Transcript_11853:772-2994(-)